MDVENDSLGVRLLADIRLVFKGAPNRKATAELLANLIALEESPWAELDGKPITDRRLAKLLRPYGIRSRVMRFAAKTARGFERSDFADAWDRYLPRANSGAGDLQATNGTLVHDDDVTESVGGLTGGVTDVTDSSDSGTPESLCFL